jgi:glycosyltransferase involved in cell wall biosynthesis
MASLPITVVIPVKNEEENLPSCLARLGGFAEIVVVDSASTDSTPEIAKSANAKLINFAWQGGFPKKRNWILLNHNFRTPWVLFLDADERLTDEFLEELPEKISNDHFVGFWLRYRNHFLGRALSHGVPQRKLALFKIGSGLYERIDESFWSELDMEVHEHPILNGPIGEIRSPIDHLDFRGLHQFIDRHNSYSTWEAKRFLQLQTDLTERHRLTSRQIAKYRYVSRWWFPPAYFMLTYIWYLGFLDRWPGFIYAVLKAYYFIQIREKIRESGYPMRSGAGTAL